MYTYNCEIVKVVDGDTLDVLINLGFEIKLKERVRLVGVNTPEVFGAKATAEGTTASDFTKAWVKERQDKPGQFVYTSKTYNTRDKYGRSLGVIIWRNLGMPEAQNLNEDLRLKGWFSK